MAAPAEASAGLNAWQRIDAVASRGISAAMGPVAQVYDLVVFAGRILRRMPRALKHRKEILSLISDMSIGAGAVVVGGGMLFVIFFLAFFTEVDLKIDEGVKLPHDTRAEIVVETLLGNKYVRLVAGNDWDHPLESGSVLRDTRTPTQVLDLQDIGTPLLENLDGKSLNDLLGKIDRISAGQRGNVGDIITGLSRLTVAINQRQTEARHLIDSTRTVTGTLANRDQDLLRSIDQINVVVDGLAQRRVELATLLDQTAQTAKKTADLVATNRPQLDAILDELHADLAIVGRRQGELVASMSGLSNAIGGFASIGYSGKDEVPNTWANMYTQLLGPISPDAVFGSCGLLDDAFDVLVGPDPIKNCANRTGPLPSSGGNPATNAIAPPSAGTGTEGGGGGGSQPAAANPLGSIYGPLKGGGS